MSAFGGKADIAPVLRSEDRMDHPPDSVSRCRELITVAVSQIDGDPIIGDRLVDPALEITVAHFKKIIALQRVGRRNPMTHENAEDLTANILIGRSVNHRSTIGFARHRPMATWQQWTRLHNRWATLALAAGGQLPVEFPLSGVKRTWLFAASTSLFVPQRIGQVNLVRGFSDIYPRFPVPTFQTQCANSGQALRYGDGYGTGSIDRPPNVPYLRIQPIRIRTVSVHP
jgi:hypothetical protein